LDHWGTILLSADSEFWRFCMVIHSILPDILFSFLFAVEELYGTRYQNGSFFLINVGSGFHCLRSFSLNFSCLSLCHMGLLLTVTGSGFSLPAYVFFLLTDN